MSTFLKNWRTWTIFKNIYKFFVNRLDKKLKLLLKIKFKHFLKNLQPELFRLQKCWDEMEGIPRNLLQFRKAALPHESSYFCKGLRFGWIAHVHPNSDRFTRSLYWCIFILFSRALSTIKSSIVLPTSNYFL